MALSEEDKTEIKQIVRKEIRENLRNALRDFKNSWSDENIRQFSPSKVISEIGGRIDKAFKEE